MNEELLRNTAAVTAQTAKMEEFLMKYDEVVGENRQLKEKISTLETRLDDKEQYSRRSTIEIHGVPHEAQREIQEQCIELVKKVGAGLGCNISDASIDACHCLRLDRRGGDRPPVIVVKFVCRIDKDNLMQKRRGKRDFSTRHMGLPMDSPVYLNESLTRERIILLTKARDARKRICYKFLWHRGGKIFMRKQEADEVIVITCKVDLDKLQ